MFCRFWTFIGLTPFSLTLSGIHATPSKIPKTVRDFRLRANAMLPRPGRTSESNEFLHFQATMLSNIASGAAGHGGEGFQLNKRPFCNAFTGEIEINPTFTVS